MHGHILVHTYTRIHVLHTHIDTYIHTLHTHTHTHIDTYVHTQTLIHNTYIHTYAYIDKSISKYTVCFLRDFHDMAISQNLKTIFSLVVALFSGWAHSSRRGEQAGLTSTGNVACAGFARNVRTVPCCICTDRGESLPLIRNGDIHRLVTG